MHLITGTRRIILLAILSASLLFSALLGVSLGMIMATNRNIQNIETFGEYQPALPSQILDIDGRLITEFFSEEKRDIISINQLPRHLIYALITREDATFFEHSGFSPWGTFRAAANIGIKVLTNNRRGYVSGGSTLTQQLAGKLYADRTQLTLGRKLKELWWSFQLERRLTKYEILELYLNKMPFGHNTYGVEAASQFYFNHSAREMTVAESAILVIQLANPSYYSPIRHPDRAKRIQKTVLDQMTAAGFITPEEMRISYDEYWNRYDWSRDLGTTAFFEREDKAPFFSEHIRTELDQMLYGKQDIYRDGYIVHTTLNLDYQRLAQLEFQTGLNKVSKRYRTSTSTLAESINAEVASVIDLLSLSFDIDEIHVASTQKKNQAEAAFQKKINPVMDLNATLFGLPELNRLAKMTYDKEKQSSRYNTVQGALICLENNTGYISALIGGSQFNQLNQLNRAIQAEVQPGSAFKPLYYSAAISSGELTPASRIHDAPIYFRNDDGSIYAPKNYGGHWYGNVRLRQALARSLNVPSLIVLKTVGFDAAINRSADLLGITEPDQIAKTFPRKYPLGLGIIRVSPIQMAKAFAVFANQGRRVQPLAIRYIEDRNGNIILDAERELRQEQKRGNQQVLTPQAAYIMTNLLQSTIDYGTLSGSALRAGGFDMPMAGKTGTTQNWSDAWAVGFSPYFTTAVWYGFDQPGNSLGVHNTGASAAGPVWARYMKTIHQDLPIRKFPKPDKGIVKVEVCAESGLLPTGDCSRTVQEIFIAGTEPEQFCDIHGFNKRRNQDILEKMEDSLYTEDIEIGDEADSSSSDPFGDLDLDLDLGSDFPDDDSGSSDKKEEEEEEEFPESIDILD